MEYSFHGVCNLNKIYLYLINNVMVAFKYLLKHLKCARALQMSLSDSPGHYPHCFLNSLPQVASTMHIVLLA